MSASTLPFGPATAGWFENNFDGPTPVQARGWPLIASGSHCLLLAPTGSGKTLAAFLYAIDRLLTKPVHGRGVRVLYVSPLKALVYDIERNLRNPLQGIAHYGQRQNLSLSVPRVAVRTGDTPSNERAHQKRDPSEILVTTPESLFLLLTSEARATLATVETVIIDEIHSLAPAKRGSHLALSLERLGALTAQEPQRIGLSATVRPVAEVAHFLGGERAVEVVDTLAAPRVDVKIIVPPKDEVPPAPPEPQTTSILGQLAAEENKLWQGGGMAHGQAAEGANSVWPILYPRLLELIRNHTSTIVFVNSRGLSERLALRLNELAGEESLVRSHHGSVSHEERQEIEEQLKSGRLKGIVATSSLELGIDMGAVDLVILVESPGAVSRGLQRVGRAGHKVGETSVARLFPKFRGDLLESAVVVHKMKRGEIEAIRVPRSPLDVLAQQIVAMCCDRSWKLPDLEALVKRAWPYRELSREVLVSVLDMLSGRYPSTEFAELRARIEWDRDADVLKARSGTKMMVLANAGTIPDRGLYGVFLSHAGGKAVRVGELDEEMVHEIRVGQNFLLGASTWRIDEITRDKVYVTPAPGQPGRMPFWKGEGPGRPLELGRALGRFVEELAKSKEPLEMLQADYSLDENAAQDLWNYVQEQKETTGTLPTHKTLTVERFRDEIGDWRVCILSPFGAQVHAPWALALEALWGQQAGFEVQTMWSDDGIVLRFADLEDLPELPNLVPDPEDVEDLVLHQLAHSSLFSGQFRENAGRALLLPRKMPGQRTPLWAQRLKAQSLLGVARNFPSFPILLETYRSCLQDIFDVKALKELLADLQARRVRLVEVETAEPSPFARSLVFQYVANFLYEGDAPLAERKAQALTLDRALLSELLGEDELRQLLDPAALEELLAELQYRVEERRARTPEALHDLLRRQGELSRAELAERSFIPEAIDELVRQRKAAELKIGGQKRFVAVEDAALYRDGLGCSLPSGLPVAFLEPTQRPLEQIVARAVRHLGPFLGVDLARRLGVPDLEPVLRLLESQQKLLRGEFLQQPGELIDPDVLRRWRRASLARLRGQVAPVDTAVLARFLERWQRAETRLLNVIGQLEGLPLSFQDLEKWILPLRLPDYHPRLLDELGQLGAVVWVGHGSLGNRDGKIALYRRERAAQLLRPNDLQLEGTHQAVLDHLERRGASFFMDIRTHLAVPTDELEDVLEDLIWAGLVTNDLFAPLRALGVPATRRKKVNPFGGRWTLVSHLMASVSETQRHLAWAQTLLERYGVVSREAAQAESYPGGFTPLYEVLKAMEESGKVRRGYFVEGLSGAQFAYAGVIDRLRSAREVQESQALSLAATDPVNPYGGLLPWPTSPGRPRRAAGARLILVDGEPVLFLEAGGRKLSTLPGIQQTDLAELGAAELARLADRSKGRRLALREIDGEPAAKSPWAPLLERAGFRKDFMDLTILGRNPT